MREARGEVMAYCGGFVAIPTTVNHGGMALEFTLPAGGDAAHAEYREQLRQASCRFDFARRGGVKEGGWIVDSSGVEPAHSFSAYSVVTSLFVRCCET
jgi:hypothetical protein